MQGPSPHARFPLTLRPARRSDRAFLFAAYRQALEAHVNWAWGWNEAWQRRCFPHNHPVAQFRVVWLGRRRIGGLHVEEGARLHAIRMLFLVPWARGRGVGTRLLAQEIRRARAAGRSLVLTVIKSNPAARLYRRLGFEVTGEDAATWRMRWQGPAGAVPAGRASVLERG